MLMGLDGLVALCWLVLYMVFVVYWWICVKLLFNFFFLFWDRCLAGGCGSMALYLCCLSVIYLQATVSLFKWLESEEAYDTVI